MNKSGKENAKKMRNLYNNGFEFPKWVLNKDIWDNLHFSKVIVYYNKLDSFNDVKKMVTEREPTNIGMNRTYNKKLLEKTFGWEVGYYEKFAVRCKYHHLAPNISIFARTPLVYKGKIKLVNVINLVGYAFDSPNQPDHKHFKDMKLNGHDLQEKYTKMWKYAFMCAKDHNLKKIQIAAVGGGAFAPKEYRGDNFVNNILKPSVKKAQQSVDPNKNIELLWEMFPDFSVPHSFGDLTQPELDITLYVNGWDPFSMVGNGNGMDRSLDGAWGNCTALAPLCWSLSNPSMKYVSCDLDKKIVNTDTDTNESENNTSSNTNTSDS